MRFARPGFTPRPEPPWRWPRDSPGQVRVSLARHGQMSVTTAELGLDKRAGGRLPQPVRVSHTHFPRSSPCPA